MTYQLIPYLNIYAAILYELGLKANSAHVVYQCVVLKHLTLSGLSSANCFIGVLFYLKKNKIETISRYSLDILGILM